MQQGRTKLAEGPCQQTHRALNNLNGFEGVLSVLVLIVLLGFSARVECMYDLILMRKPCNRFAGTPFQ